MTQVTIDVSEEEMGDWSLQNGNSVMGKVKRAYEAEKNKIRVGDWFLFKLGADLAVYKAERVNELAKTITRAGYSDYSPHYCTKLSQPLQDLLNKEMA